jgi:hypothetical protein
MAENIFDGDIVGISVNGLELVCNTAATVNLTANLTENPTCKPLSTSSYARGQWVTQTVTSRTGTITGTALAVADPVTGATIKDSGILSLFMVGAQVTVTVNTRETSNYPYPTVRVFEADCIISDFTWTNDNGSPSSSDFTFTINGEPTYTDEPYVS